MRSCLEICLDRLHARLGMGKASVNFHLNNHTSEVLLGQSHYSGTKQILRCCGNKPTWSFKLF